MKPPPPSLHSNFFSSLKQVEKRLKLEHPLQPAPLPPPPLLPLTESQLQEGNFSSRGSLSSPLFLHLGQASECSATQDDTEATQAFFSISQRFPPAHQDLPQISARDHPRIENEAEDDEQIDDIERLMQLLGLSEQEDKTRDDFDGDSDANSCHCEDGFYSKIVGVKGPKCKKEEKRLDKWIKHFLNGCGEEKKEPLRLAHLLLGKAAFVSEGSDCGFGGLDFPSTIQDFLHKDPPSD
ncbi:hypothetical protein L6164_035453 [Bauhinia variegata]|uniref:Uncharacterized protein n=1 Tax=Bauhinia variegata TaxID=167791 RepID=A0ACB9KE04_BAUVA|nr:hypothetical protein L6164_035453 [Bauhinia variegata]